MPFLCLPDIVRDRCWVTMSCCLAQSGSVDATAQVPAELNVLSSSAHRYISSQLESLSSILLLILHVQIKREKGGATNLSNNKRRR